HLHFRVPFLHVPSLASEGGWPARWSLFELSISMTDGRERGRAPRRRAALPSDLRDSSLRREPDVTCGHALVPPPPPASAVPREAMRPRAEPEVRFVVPVSEV